MWIKDLVSREHPAALKTLYSSGRNLFFDYQIGDGYLDRFLGHYPEELERVDDKGNNILFTDQTPLKYQLELVKRKPDALKQVNKYGHSILHNLGCCPDECFARMILEKYPEMLAPDLVDFPIYDFVRDALLEKIPESKAKMLLSPAASTVFKLKLVKKFPELLTLEHARELLEYYMDVANRQYWAEPSECPLITKLIETFPEVFIPLAPEILRSQMIKSLKDKVLNLCPEALTSLDKNGRNLLWAPLAS